MGVPKAICRILNMYFIISLCSPKSHYTSEAVNVSTQTHSVVRITFIIDHNIRLPLAIPWETATQKEQKGEQIRMNLNRYLNLLEPR